VEAFAYQARRYGGGVYAGNPEDLMNQQQKQFAEQLVGFPDESGLHSQWRKMVRRRVPPL